MGVLRSAIFWDEEGTEGTVAAGEWATERPSLAGEGKIGGFCIIFKGFESSLQALIT
jgi:hypothetical protein